MMREERSLWACCRASNVISTRFDRSHAFSTPSDNRKEESGLNADVSLLGHFVPDRTERLDKKHCLDRQSLKVLF